MTGELEWISIDSEPGSFRVISPNSRSAGIEQTWIYKMHDNAWHINRQFTDERSNPGDRPERCVRYPGNPIGRSMTEIAFG